MAFPSIPRLADETGISHAEARRIAVREFPVLRHFHKAQPLLYYQVQKLRPIFTELAEARPVLDLDPPGMTVREVAETLGVAERTIQRHAKEILNSDNVVAVEHGKTTILDEETVTEIKRRIERSGRGDLESVAQASTATTELEMKMKAAEVLSWLISENGRLQEQVTELQPKALVADRISDASGLRTLSEVGKVNGIGPRKIFDVLIGRGIIFKRRGIWLPYQDYVEAGYFLVRERVVEVDGEDKLYLQTYVTGKGELWLAKQLF